MPRTSRRSATDAEVAEMDAAHARREELIRRACRVMGWEYSSSPVWTGLRKVAVAEAVPVGLDKLEEMLNEIERLRA